jgi:hypothetical protein
MIQPVRLALGAAAAGTAYFFGRLFYLSSHLETVTKVNVFKVDFTSITLSVDVTLKNPTSVGVTLIDPFITMQYKGVTFATSESKNKIYTLPKHGEVKFDTVMVTIDLITLATKAAQMVADIRKNGSVAIDVLAKTTLDKLIGYTKSEPYTLSNPIAS